MNNNLSNPGQTSELRKVLFDQIRRLNDPSLDLEKELKRANSIGSLGNVIVNSVKVELDFVRVTRQAAGKTNIKVIENGKASKKGKLLGNGK